MEFYTDYLSKEDRTKLLNEINQIHTQRFQLTLSGITAFGVFLAWIIPKADLSSNSTSELIFAEPSLLLILLLLFLYSHTLNKTQITLAAYVIETGQSKWEKDSKESRGTRGAGFNYIQSSIFILLGLIALVCPFIINHFDNLQYPDFDAAKALLKISGIIYVAIIISFSYFIRVRYQTIATKKWKTYFEKNAKAKTDQSDFLHKVE